ncbi:hypothetical protein [Brachybacterium paraconglomeratum]|uniref:hypothetical protein n=1 Tax=Brachybacterium paraconglomeratum TaxID=173362 RepID=UPI0022B04860|nr:hypothetical protein [Brachybacterium paraconglomeratum]MCZ4326756.1 hypothetical protein [Brachybacterium paraconglomeratum]
MEEADWRSSGEQAVSEAARTLRIIAKNEGDAMDGEMLWSRWGDLTRYMSSALIAFRRESRLWGELEFDDPKSVTIGLKAGSGKYQVKLEQHRSVMQDEQTLFSTVLVSSYALAEGAAGFRLQKDAASLGGIETWGSDLLSCNARSWDDVPEGKSGAVEVAVVRNYYAHGLSSMNERSINRLVAVGNSQFELGDVIILDAEKVTRYRSLLKDLLRKGGIRGEVNP